MSKTPDQRQATGLVFLQKAAATGGLSEGSGQTFGLIIDAFDETLIGTPGR